MDRIGVLKTRVLSAYLAVSRLDGHGPHRLRPKVLTGLDEVQPYRSSRRGDWVAGVYEPTFGPDGYNPDYAPGYVTVGRTEEEALQNLLDWLKRRAAEFGACRSTC